MDCFNVWNIPAARIPCAVDVSTEKLDLKVAPSKSAPAKGQQQTLPRMRQALPEGGVRVNMTEMFQKLAIDIVLVMRIVGQ